MESNKDKKIIHLIENINDKLGEFSEKVNSGQLKEELNDYKDHFAKAGAKIKKGHEFK
jgi:hypothetical protein